MRWRRQIRLVEDGLSVAADVNLAVNVNQHGSVVSSHQDSSEAKGVPMTDEAGFKPLSRDELHELAGEELPERAAMSLVNANVAIPINAAVAANVLSDNATAAAEAAQSGQIDQAN